MWRGLPQLGHGPGEGGPEGPPRGRQAPHQPEKPQGRRPWDQHRHLWDSPTFQRHRAVCGSLTRKVPRSPPEHPRAARRDRQEGGRTLLVDGIRRQSSSTWKPQVEPTSVMKSRYPRYCVFPLWLRWNFPTKSKKQQGRTKKRQL